MNDKLTRRFFGASALTGLATAGLVTPAAAKTARELRMLMVWPTNFPGMGTSAARFAERVDQLSQGDLRIRIYGAGEIVSAFEALDAVAGGAGDMTHCTSYYWSGKDPAFNYFAVIPFGLTADEHFTWLKFGGGQELWDELGAQHGVKPLAVFNSGPQMGGWFRDEINSVSDLQGKKLRFPGLGGLMLGELGAIPTNIPGSELFSALQSGTIDGLEWVAPWNDLAFGFHRAASHYYYPGFHEMGHCGSSYVNLEVWNSLTETQRTILQNAADAEYVTSLSEFNARNLSALDTMVSEHGVQLHRWPDEITDRVLEIAPRVIEANAAGSPMATRVHENWIAFRDEQRRWSAIGDYPNAELRQRG